MFRPSRFSKSTEGQEFKSLSFNEDLLSSLSPVPTQNSYDSLLRTQNIIPAINAPISTAATTMTPVSPSDPSRTSARPDNSLLGGSAGILTMIGLPGCVCE